jgi:phosphatidylglycerol:prolipoprotein diacylglycerol transferase
MYQTLYTIPGELAGIPVFGFGWLLAAWVIGSLLILGWQSARHGWGPEARGYLPAIALGAAAIAFLLPRLVEPPSGAAMQSAAGAEQANEQGSDDASGPAIGGLPIRGYGVMLLIAVASAVAMSVYRAERVGLDPEMILSLAFWLFVAGILGARLFYIIEYWDKFQQPTLGATLAMMANVAQGGLVVYGSLLAGGLALAIFVYKHHLPGLALCDLIAPSVVLGMALGRIGCFLNGCCYGGISSVPWHVTFPWHSPPHQQQVFNNDLYVHGLLFAGTGEASPVIAKVEPDSPAEHAGLKAGQRVTWINGAKTETIEKAQLVLLELSGEGRKIAIRVGGDPQIKSWTLHGTLPRSLAVHPAQLYSFFDSLLLCLFLLAYYPYRRRDGELMALTLTLHPISRFLLEIIRVDESAVFSTPWSISQNISLALLASAVLVWIYLWRQPRQVAFPKAAVAG